MTKILEVAVDSLASARAAIADGFVLGCLTAEGDLDENAMEPMLKAAQGCGLTLHRCIAVSRDPCKTYLNAKELGALIPC